MLVPPALAALVDTLHDDDGFADAACRGLAGLWDSHLPGEAPQDAASRHELARRVCATCRARPACADLAGTYPSDDLDGIWAGHLYRPARTAETV